jgi:hypothetical protein
MPGCFFLLCILPQRWFYDSFLLWLIPKTRRSILATVACSWMVGLWRWYHMPTSMRQVGFWVVLGFFLPMLAIVLLRSRAEKFRDADSAADSIIATNTRDENS